ncbi:MAG: rRNA maturation RNase YbeY [Candidatus Omnitrophota bacterium]
MSATTPKIGIILVSDKKITLYNRKFLEREGSTDVISFRLGPGEGDILISVERAKSQAKEYHHPLEKELLILAVHGFLHLAGYDDRTEKKRRRMFAETERIVRAAYREYGRKEA